MASKPGFLLLWQAAEAPHLQMPSMHVHILQQPAIVLLITTRFKSIRTAKCAQSSHSTVTLGFGTTVQPPCSLLVTADPCLGCRIQIT